MSRISKLGALHSIHLIFRRSKTAKRELNEKIRAIDCKKLSDEQNREIDLFWKGIRIDKRYLSFYNTIHSGKFDSRYIPDNIYYRFIDLFYNNALKAYFLSDKNIMELYLSDFSMPKTIARKMNGLYLDKFFQKISKEQVVSMCYGNKIVIKKSVESCGGHGVFVCKPECTKDEISNILDKFEDCVIQEYFKQHNESSNLHENSVNTIRITTFCDKEGNVKVLAPIIRIGIGDSCVDNASSGGVFCGIHADGHLMSKAYFSSGAEYRLIPNGKPLEHHSIPNFEQCKNLVKKAALRFATTSRLLSWDIAIDEDGNPAIIEVNLSYGSLYTQQITHGPIFGDDTKEILDEVFSRKIYRIINRLFG